MYKKVSPAQWAAYSFAAMAIVLAILAGVASTISSYNLVVPVIAIGIFIMFAFVASVADMVKRGKPYAHGAKKRRRKLLSALLNG